MDTMLLRWIKHTHIYIYIHTYINTYIYIYICKCIHKHIYIYIDTHIYIYTQMHIYIYTWSILFDSMMMSIYNCILMTIIHHSGVSRLHPSRWPKATCSTSHVPSPSPSVSWSLRQKRVDHQNLGVYTWIIHIYIHHIYACFVFPLDM